MKKQQNNPTSRPDIAALQVPQSMRKILRKSVRVTKDECWLLPSTKSNPYSVVYFKKTGMRGHRIFKIWAMGHKFEFGKIVCHLCENKNCVNPRHSYLGTHKDNALDRIRSGITTAKTFGEMRKNSKITASIARDIYTECMDPGTNRASVARRYKINKISVYNILSKKTWKHATEDLPRISAAKRNYSIKGSKNNLAKLNEATVVKICESLCCDVTVAAVARQFGITWHHAHSIKKKQSWRHISCNYNFEKSKKSIEKTIYKKLCPNDVVEIRRLHANGIKQTIIAKRFNIGSPLVSRICRRLTWGHI